MADYFSEQAREALNLAYRAARTMNNSHIGTEHILLGLVRQGTGVAARVLMENEVTEKKLTEMIDRVLKPRQNTLVGDEPQYSPMAKRVIENSHREAERFHLELWGLVHGTAVMLATGYLDLDEETVGGMLTDVYQGLKQRWRIPSPLP